MRRLSSIVIALCWAAPAYAGAWLMPEGQGQAIFQSSYFESNKYWDADGNSHNQNRFRKEEFQPYLEYGLTDKVTVGGTFFAQRDSQSGSINHGIADPEFFLRSKLWQGDGQLLSIQPLLKLPSRFDHNHGTPRGGSRSTDAELTLLYGRNLNILSNRDYLDASVGYRWRSQGLHPQFKTDLAVGISPWAHWQFIPALRYLQGSDINSASGFSQNGELDYTLLKAEFTTMYKLESGNWLQASYFRHLAGEQTGNGQGVSIGYAIQF